MLRGVKWKGETIAGVPGYDGPVCCVILPARLLVNRLTMNLRLSSTNSSARAPSMSGQKIHAGKGLVPKIALPGGIDDERQDDEFCRDSPKDQWNRGAFSSNLQKENLTTTCQRATHDQD